MPALSARLRKLFAKTKLVILPEDYLLIHLPLDSRQIPAEWYRPATTHFAVFIREPRGITLAITRRKWLRMRNLFKKYEVSGPMKVVTFDIEIPLDVHGYIAPITKTLADGGISVVLVSTYVCDHILVRKEDLPRSIRLLRQFRESCKG